MGKNDEKMKEDGVFKLIEYARDHPYLWQMKLKEFKDQKLKLRSFREIAKKLGYTVEVVMRRWENLKIGYRREKRRRADEAYSGAPGPYAAGDHAGLRDDVASEDPEASGDNTAPEDVDMEDDEAPKRKRFIFFDALKFLEKMRESKETYTNLVPKEESSQTSEHQDSSTQSKHDSPQIEDENDSSVDDLSEASKTDSAQETNNDLLEDSKVDKSEDSKDDLSENSKNDLSKKVKTELPEETEDDLVDLTEDGDSDTSEISVKENSPVKMKRTDTHNSSPDKKAHPKKKILVKKECSGKKNAPVKGISKKSGFNRPRVSPPQAPLKPVKLENMKNEDSLVSPLLRNLSNQFESPSACYNPATSKQRKSDPLEQCFMNVSTQLTNFVASQGAAPTLPDTDEMFGQTVAKELQKLPEDAKNKKKFLIMKALYET